MAWSLISDRIFWYFDGKHHGFFSWHI